MNINDFYQKLDGYFAQHDTGAIEKFMIDSLTTARTENDTAAIVAVSNELAGFYRASGTKRSSCRRRFCSCSRIWAKRPPRISRWRCRTGRTS